VDGVPSGWHRIRGLVGARELVQAPDPMVA
jgi:hypothetical protein